MYDLFLEKSVLKFLSKLDNITTKRILQKLISLKNNPYPSDAKRITNHKDKIFRIRIGFYRALYRVEDNKLVVVFLINKRNKVYKN